MIDFDLKDISILEKLNNLHQFLDFSLGNKTLLPPGPIHFNIRFDEPLIDKHLKTLKTHKKIYDNTVYFQQKNICMNAGD